MVKLANNIKIAKMLRDRFPHPFTAESGKFYFKMVSEQYAAGKEVRPAQSCTPMPWIDVRRSLAVQEAFCITVDDVLVSRLSVAYLGVSQPVVPQVGGIAVHPKTGEERITAEIGFWLGEPFWGHGITTAAVLKFVPFVWAHYPEVIRLQSQVGRGAARILM
jgi:hypothetical protein